MDTLGAFTKLPRELCCEGRISITVKAARLVCQAAECAEAGRATGELIGRHPFDEKTAISDEEIRRSALLEIPDVCPRLADFDALPRRSRLPEGLR